MATVEVWECEHCDFVYKSPTKISGISHMCSKAAGWGGPLKSANLKKKVAKKK